MGNSPLPGSQSGLRGARMRGCEVRACVRQTDRQFKLGHEPTPLPALLHY